MQRNNNTVACCYTVQSWQQTANCCLNIVLISVVAKDVVPQSMMQESAHRICKLSADVKPLLLEQGRSDDAVTRAQSTCQDLLHELLNGCNLLHGTPNYSI